MSRFDLADGLVLTGVLSIAAGFLLAWGVAATLFWLGLVLTIAGLLRARRAG